MTKEQIIKAMKYWEITACVQSEMVTGSSELRAWKGDLDHIKLSRKVLKKIYLTRFGNESAQMKANKKKDIKTVEVELMKMTDSLGTLGLFLYLHAYD